MTIDEMKAITDDEIDTSDIPELGEEFWDNAELVDPAELAKQREDYLNDAAEEFP